MAYSQFTPLAIGRRDVCLEAEGIRTFLSATGHPTMRNLLTKLWRDESGVVSPEWAFIVTILVLGAVTGIVASRQAQARAYTDPAIYQPK